MKSVLLLALAIVAISICPAVAEVDPVNYLFNYGYLETMDPTTEEMEAAYLEFQRMYNLPLSGTMDDETLQKMKLPRCGVQDKMNQNGKLNQYTLIRPRKSNLISWSIPKYSKTSPLSHAKQRELIKRAFMQWSRVSPLVFREVRANADIPFSFVEKWHMGHTFKPSALAHAYPPPSVEGVHMLEDVHWDLTNLETVAAHEIGHTLGLNHSSHQSALMFGVYQENTREIKLGADDIAGIRALYGRKPSRAVKVNNALPEDNRICNISYRRIDAAMRISGNDFVFIDSSAVIDVHNGHKMAVRTLFPAGPHLVQASVYSDETSLAYLFNDKYAWAYSYDSNGTFHLEVGFPKYLPNRQSQNPECAMKFDYAGRETIILIKNRYYVDFFPDPESLEHVGVFPTVDTFQDIPQQIDATISSEDETYIIVKKNAYRMRHDNRIVDILNIPVRLAFNKCRT